jgi:hypothetical protein
MGTSEWTGGEDEQGVEIGAGFGPEVNGNYSVQGMNGVGMIEVEAGAPIHCIEERR